MFLRWKIERGDLERGGNSKALFIVDHVPEPGQFKNDCVKTFIFRKTMRKVKQSIFHLVSSPDVPDFQSITYLR
jgi:hypothetical protein